MYMNGNEPQKTMAFTSSVMLYAADHSLLVADILPVWHNMHNAKSVIQSPHGSSGQDFAAAPAVPRATSSDADTELSCRSYLRPDGPTAASRCPLHRTWNQRLCLPVFQHLSTS